MGNPVCVVTGATGGIGQQIVLDFAKQGYDVVINYSKHETSALALAEQCQILGVQSLVLGFDVSNPLEVETNMKKVFETFNRIDVLINNAGITRDGLVLRMSEQAFDDVIRINLKGTFNCSKAVLRYMLKAHHGRIINISSVIGLIGNLGQANYAASKAGIHGLTKALAKEVALRQITVNAIAPGFIETSMTEVLSEEVRTMILKQIPVGRFGKVEDVAQCAIFLASAHAAYINGQVIQVDGGMVM